MVPTSTVHACALPQQLLLGVRVDSLSTAWSPLTSGESRSWDANSRNFALRGGRLLNGLDGGGSLGAGRLGDLGQGRLGGHRVQALTFFPLHGGQRAETTRERRQLHGLELGLSAAQRQQRHACA